MDCSRSQAPLVGLVEIHRRSEIYPREQPVGVAPERVLTASVRADLVAQHRGEPAVRVGRRRGPLLQARHAALRCRVRRRPPCRRTAAGSGQPARSHAPPAVPRADGRRPPPLAAPSRSPRRGRERGTAARLTTRPVLVGVGGHQVEHIAHRLQRRGDHVELADIESRVVQLDLDAEPFPHRGERHDVDVVLRCDAVQLPQC